MAKAMARAMRASTREKGETFSRKLDLKMSLKVMGKFFLSILDLWGGGKRMEGGRERKKEAASKNEWAASTPL